MDHDLLPVLGMLILQRLAKFHTKNCMKISSATGLTSTIIEFRSNITDLTDIYETHEATMKGFSLKVLRILRSTEGRIDVKLRSRIGEHPFLRNPTHGSWIKMAAAKNLGN